ncbi:multidrug MFS transporter [Sphingopyxis sp. Root214]|uniref:epoxide hydrolase family protein n=1 Tax=Sphingopyxis sp. Root214 TaxID=1736491 RepID=UPI0006FBAAD2|nr:epoxide hydrolase family protein [Sphingopyxis sp. Root214]KQZ72534.1 multidrug MFS transporter [Sphingopyxis sp. Root154]KRC06681.1 multidrug MFS transporter [Sphingopyxis sp. Root214]
MLGDFTPSRRGFVTTAATLGALAAVPSVARTGNAAIRPFKVAIPDPDLAAMKRRVAETRWADAQPVADDSQGVRRQTLEAMMRYWAGDYDWRKVEARLNALPMFLTEIDGLDIHFIHVRSRHDQAMPMILTHGWPGSILEFMRVIDPLTNPTAHGGEAEDAFHLVIPSIPGFGFSGKPTVPGWGSDHIGRAWSTLMLRLGYDRYVSQGGDCGSVISQRMALQHVPGLAGIHLNMPAVVPADIARTLAAGDPAPASLTARERGAFDQLEAFYRDNSAYAAMMNTRPQTIGYSLVDSPVGMAAWMYEKIAQWVYADGQTDRVLGRDAILDDISLYWLTGTGASAARIYWEDHSNNFNARGVIDMPVAVSVFPGEIFRAPRSWAERCYTNLTYFNEVSDGGHFAAWEQPQLFAEEVRAAFRPLR